MVVVGGREPLSYASRTDSVGRARAVHFGEFQLFIGALLAVTPAKTHPQKTEHTPRHQKGLTPHQGGSPSPEQGRADSRELAVPE